MKLSMVSPAVAILSPSPGCVWGNTLQKYCVTVTIYFEAVTKWYYTFSNKILVILPQLLCPVTHYNPKLSAHGCFSLRVYQWNITPASATSKKSPKEESVW